MVMARGSESPRSASATRKAPLDRPRRQGALRVLGLVALAAAGSGTAAAAFDASSADASRPPATSPVSSATTVSGVVTGLHGTSLVLWARQGARKGRPSSVTILLEGTTRYREGGHKEARTVLHDGERVRVRLAPKAPRATALVVEVLPPQWTGTLGGLGHGRFALSQHGRTLGRVLLTRTTHVRSGGHAAATSALHDGERVRVTGTLAHGTITARTVVILGARRRSGG